MQVANDGKMEGFRFYDEEFVVDGDKSYDGDKSNFSNWIYFGKRMSLEEVKAQYGNDSRYSLLISNMENNNYQYACHTQAGSFLPMKEGDMTFDELVAAKEQDKEAQAKVMFDKLREHIGEDVSYTGWWYGAKLEETAELRNVTDFINVEIGCSSIPFVGYGAAISSITSKDGEVLYSNPNIEYRYENVTILLLNAWELILKAFIRKYTRKSIFKGNDYTISIDEAISITKKYLTEKEKCCKIEKELTNDDSYYYLLY